MAIPTCEKSWKFMSAAALWTLVCNGSFGYMVEHEPKHLKKDVVKYGKINILNKKIKEVIKHMEEYDIDFFLSRAEDFGYFGVRGSDFCFPPDWLVEQMKQFEETKYIPLDYAQHILSI